MGARWVQFSPPAPGTDTGYVVTGGAELYETFTEPAPAWNATREAVHDFLVLDISDGRIDAREVYTFSSIRGVDVASEAACDHRFRSASRAMSRTPRCT